MPDCVNIRPICTCKMCCRMIKSITNETSIRNVEINAAEISKHFSIDVQDVLLNKNPLQILLHFQAKKEIYTKLLTQLCESI